MDRRIQQFMRSLPLIYMSFHRMAFNLNFVLAFHFLCDYSIDISIPSILVDVFGEEKYVAVLTPSKTTLV